MDTNFMWLIVSWVAIEVTLIGLMFFRKHASRNEDDFLHLSYATASTLNTQAPTARQMDVLDRWFSIFLIAVLVHGLGIGAWFLYQVWLANSKLVS